MKYKIKHEKKNLVLMSSLIVLCIFNCIAFYILHEYLYTVIYSTLTLVLSYIYYFTYYYIKDNYLLIRLGFIVIRHKYNKILFIKKEKDRIRLNFKRISFCIYPDELNKFYKELNKKVGVIK